MFIQCIKCCHILFSCVVCHLLLFFKLSLSPSFFSLSLSLSSLICLVYLSMQSNTFSCNLRSNIFMCVRLDSNEIYGCCTVPIQCVSTDAINSCLKITGINFAYPRFFIAWLIMQGKYFYSIS